MNNYNIKPTHQIHKLTFWQHYWLLTFVHNAIEAFTINYIRLTMIVTTIKKTYAFAETMSLVFLGTSIFTSLVPSHHTIIQHTPMIKHNKPGHTKSHRQAFKILMAFHHFHMPLNCNSLTFFLTNNYKFHLQQNNQ